MTRGGRAAHGLALAACLLLVAGPFIALLCVTLQAVAAGHADWLLLALPLGRRLGLLRQSLVLAACVSVGGVAIGTLAATVLWRWRTGPCGALRWLVVLMAPVPPYLHALAWAGAASAVNAALARVGLPGIRLEGWAGSVWVQTMALLPIAAGLALVGLESVENGLVEAALVTQPPLQALRQVILPLAAPAILAGAGLTFLLSLMDYSVPSLLGVSVYALEIFAEFSATNEPARALLLALPLVAVGLGVLGLAQSWLRQAASTRPARAAAPAPAWPGWLRGLQGLALVLAGAQVLVPLLVQGALAGVGGALLQATVSARHEIGYTFGVALSVALLALPLAGALAAELARSGGRARAAWLAVTLPLALPAPLAGIGLIAIWNRPGALGLYGSGWMPVLAALARFTPLAAVAVLAQRRRLDPLLLDAGRVFERRPWQGWLLVRLPLLGPGLLAAGGLCFALALGELGATLIVAPPGQATLAMRIYNLLHYGASGQVAGLGLLMAGATLAGGLLAAAAWTGWGRLLPAVRGGQP